ncbi:MAG: hypothetical protein ACE5M4_09100 [Anaerolineales bacterium]
MVGYSGPIFPNYNSIFPSNNSGGAVIATVTTTATEMSIMQSTRRRCARSYHQQGEAESATVNIDTDIRELVPGPDLDALICELFLGYATEPRTDEWGNSGAWIYDPAGQRVDWIVWSRLLCEWPALPCFCSNTERALWIAQRTGITVGPFEGPGGLWEARCRDNNLSATAGMVELAILRCAVLWVQNGGEPLLPKACFERGDFAPSDRTFVVLAKLMETTTIRLERRWSKWKSSQPKIS